MVHSVEIRPVVEAITDGFYQRYELMPLLVPMIDSLREKVRLYEILKAFLLQINKNEAAILGVGGTGTATIPGDGNQSDVLTFNSTSPTKTEWKAPHEIDTYVSGVF